jgi:hypothetical protein
MSSERGEERQKRWSVKLRIRDDELGPVSGLWAPNFAVGARHIRFDGSSENSDTDPPSITFELQAASFSDAEERAQTAALRMRRALKLPDAVLPVIWLAPVGDDDASSRYLDHARDMIDGELYGLAVIAAQIHFEVQLAELLKEAAGQAPPRWSQRLLRERGVAELKREQSFAAVELLLGVDVTQLPEWPRFQDHVERRNDVAHRGQAVAKEQAEDSLNVVRELWAKLSAVARG